MYYLRTRAGMWHAIRRARRIRAEHGRGLHYTLTCSPDRAAFYVSAWRGGTLVACSADYQ